MTAVVKQIEMEVERLPLEDMLALHEHLIVSIQHKEDEEGFDPAFRAAVQRRVREIDSGKEQGVDAFEALEGMQMPALRKAVKLHTEARAELQDSVRYYREHGGERQVARFKRRMQEGFEAIAVDPERYRPAPELEGVQKFPLKQFPLSLLYINRPDFVWVVAIAHRSRKPGYWLGRVA